MQRQKQFCLAAHCIDHTEAAKPNGHISAGVHRAREQQGALGNFGGFGFYVLFVAENFHVLGSGLSFSGERAEGLSVTYTQLSLYFDMLAPIASIIQPFTWQQLNTFRRRMTYLS